MIDLGLKGDELLPSVFTTNDAYDFECRSYFQNLIVGTAFDTLCLENATDAYSSRVYCTGKQFKSTLV